MEIWVVLGFIVVIFMFVKVAKYLIGDNKSNSQYDKKSYKNNENERVNEFLKQVQRNREAEASSSSGKERSKKKEMSFSGANEQPMPDNFVPTTNSMGDYYITYLDGEGKTTKRAISVIKYDSYYISAYCHLRNSVRTFIIYAIKDAVNLSTGEIVHDIIDDLRSNLSTSHYGRHKSIINDEIDAINILLFVAKADGRMVKSERKYIVDYLLSVNKELDSATLDEMIKKLKIQSSLEFKKLVVDMSMKNREKLSRIYLLSTKIVETGKELDPMEQEALITISEALT